MSVGHVVESTDGKSALQRTKPFARISPEKKEKVLLVVASLLLVVRPGAPFVASLLRS